MNLRTIFVAMMIAALLLLAVILGQALEAQEKDDILYWTCGMHPSVRSEGPGKCPICNMDLVPVRASEGEQGGFVSLTLSERARELAGVRTSAVDYLPLERIIRTVGQLDYDERRRAHIASWVSGRIDKLFVDFTGTKVAKGEPLLWIYSPALVTAQQEYLLSLETVEKVQGSSMPQTVEDARALLQSSRQKLLLMGMTEDQIQELAPRGSAETHSIIAAPLSGTVIHKGVQEGQYVREGQHLFEIAGLSNLWMLADVFETDYPLIETGQEVEVTTPAYPGEVFHGRVSFIDPFLDNSTRAVHIRVDVPNPGGKLKPGLSVEALLRVPLGKSMMDFYSCPMHPQVVSGQPGECPECGMFLEKTSAGLVLAVPTSAVLDVGTRKLAYLDGGDGRYVPREVEVGPEAAVQGEAEKFLPILSGLAKGDLVVTRANFLIDSQSQLTGHAAGAYGGALETKDGEHQHVH